MNKVSFDAHGGCGLICKTLPHIEAQKLLSKYKNNKVYHISDADLSIFYRISDGTLSPLQGPMDSKEFYEVLDNEVIERNEKKYAWTIPIAFPIKKEKADKLEVGETVLVKNSKDNIIGILKISDIYPFNKDRYNKSVYGTERKDHPGARIFNEDDRDYLLGGEIWNFGYPHYNEFDKYMLSPNEARTFFASRKWEKIVAFQTRNALHRAHEYALLYATEALTREGYFTGAVLNPLVGATKSDDVPADVRMKTYEDLIETGEFGRGDFDNELWAEKGYSFTDNLLLIGLDMKMFYAGPKEAIMHSIYRQNYGFTNIVIGRKHADAPFDDGTAIWGDFDAHEKFDKLDGELLIQPSKVGFAAYFTEIERVGLIKDFKPKGYHTVFISGKAVRKTLQEGKIVDERIMHKSVSDILVKFYTKSEDNQTKQKATNITWHDTGITKEIREQKNNHKGIVLWFTGLSGSGKSTVATKVQEELFKKNCQVYILDGDNVRHGLNRDLGFSPEDREENIRRIGEVAHLFAQAGIIAITSFISPYSKDRDKARSLNKENEFIEIFVKAPLQVCEDRDPKGLYKKVRAGIIKEFTGISAPYEEPEKAEIVIDTSKLSIEESAQKVLDYLKDKEIIS